MKFLKSIPWSLILMAIVAIFLFVSCASNSGIPDPITGISGEPLTYNFFGGLLHGAVMPFAFVFSLASPYIEMYASNNIGSWYDFGYLLGVVLSIGGGIKATTALKNFG